MRNLSEKYFPLMEKHLKSKFCAKGFCKNNGINIKTLYYWKKKYRESGNKSGNQLIKAGFTALLVVDVAKETEVIIQYPMAPASYYQAHRMPLW
jgi:hypothetical protein